LPRIAGAPHECRTAAAGLAKLGCPRVVQGRILNHVDGSVSAIYDRHRYDAEARVWLQKWADYLESLTVRNVIPFRAAQQGEGLPISSRRVPAAPAWANEVRD